ncbi:ABC transporter ATP-binding protein [Enterococcus sp.]|uniref:ABC transporter ATP-binding protein n=1 Tax=Enterococcus sp. TaxID=35783 RepID=UPI0025C729E2|nr:ABC transporter ATP-binding protein [Enterococcus sp.]
MGKIDIANLTRDYGNGKGVFDLSFSVTAGAFGFLGPNGAGKTTTIRHLMGFIKPQSGSCLINGLDCWHERDQIQKNLGYIPGEMTFFEEMTGTEMIHFIAKYRGSNENGRAKELLDRFELDPSGKIKKMSKGMKQKVGIVIAFMHDPEILILDEPTSGLDPLMQSRFIDLITEEKKRGKTILMSSHMFEEVERTCDRIGIIRSGKLVALDSTDNLRDKHLRRYTVTLANEQQAKDFAADFHGQVEAAQPCQVQVSTSQTLEQIFMDYYGGEDK